MKRRHQRFAALVAALGFDHIKNLERAAVLKGATTLEVGVARLPNSRRIVLVNDAVEFGVGVLCTGNGDTLLIRTADTALV